VATIAGGVIARHGLKEWKIVVLTNEFHEHLGIYSILGAKMGLRAREYFHVGIDELNIVTFAGSNPPVSCMNDGLQSSTGATLGHGTIELGDGTVYPSARFAFKNFQIQLTVRKEIRSQIKKDVGYGVQTYGLNSPEYWTYIRELALKYWLELDRFDIFDIRLIEP
jgi:pyrimidine-specific ribonucleoside hydrolase